MRLVLDTNVLIAAMVADGLCRDLVRKRIHSHTLISSGVLMKELAETLRRKFDMDPDKLPLCQLYADRVDMVKPVRLADTPVCRDPSDDAVLATAVAGKADMIVTGDQDMLILKQYGGVSILAPRQFLEILDQAD